MKTKHFFAIILTTILMGFAWTASPIASPIFVGETRDLEYDPDWWWDAPISERSHKDSEFNVNWLVDTYSGSEFLPANLEFLGKWDDGWESSAVWGNGDPYFTGDFSGTSGSWQTTDAWGGGPVYFSIKAGREFELYYAGTDLSDVEVLWDTLGITNHKGKAKKLSHMTFWTADNPPGPDPVPEPSTILLLGIGLLIAAGYARKRLQPVPVKK